jgi:hypothetical protein
MEKLPVCTGFKAMRILISGALQCYDFCYVDGTVFDK